MGGERAGEINGVIVAASHPRRRGRSPPVPAVPSLLLVQRGEVKGGGPLAILQPHRPRRPLTSISPPEVSRS